MNKTWLVLRNEVVSNLARPSFIITVLLVPLLGVIALAFSSLRAGRPPAIAAPAASAGPGTSSSLQLAVEGYVDQAGLIHTIPVEVSDKLIQYPDEASAKKALGAGDIASYYIVPADYVESGNLVHVDPDFGMAKPEGQSWIMRWTLLVNLMGGETQRAWQVWDPMDLHVTALAPTREEGFGEDSLMWVVYAATLVLYVTILMAGSLLRSSMGNERKNRLMEILVSSVQPRQLVLGKMLGLGILGILQTTVWAGTGYLVLRLGGRTLNLPASAQLSPSIVAWAVVFFLLGYAVYASLLAGLGAVAGPNVAGSASADVWVVWPLLVPILAQVVFWEQPNGAIGTALSFFPLTAPVAMIARLAAGGVPAWQPFAAAALMLGTAFLVVRAVSRVFRAQFLLSGQPFTFRQYLAVLVGRT